MERFSALVLSHDLEAVRVINKALEEYGLEANIVRSVRDANELLKERRYDLAVCDYDLPGTRQFAYLEPNSPWRGMVFALIGRDRAERNSRTTDPSHSSQTSEPRPLGQRIESGIQRRNAWMTGWLPRSRLNSPECDLSLARNCT